MGIDVEKSSSRRHASAGALLVSREGDEHNVFVFPADPRDGFLQIFPFLVTGSQVLRLIRDRYEFHIDHEFAAPFRQRIDKLLGRDFLYVLRGDRNGCAEDDAPFPAFFHIADLSGIHTFAAAVIRGVLFPFDAHDGDQVPAAVEKIQIFFTHVGSVGEDGKNDAGDPGSFLNDIPAEHGFASGQQDKADAQFFRFTEDVSPLLSGKLFDRLAVYRRLVVTGIASGTVKIAGAGDAGDEE